MVTLTTEDHMMVGLTSLLLYIAVKMMVISPFLSVFMIWLNLGLFDRYGRRRRDETS